MKWLKKHRQKLLPACYLCGLALLLLWHLGGFVANRVLYATGALAPAELTVDDFELWDLEQREGFLASTTGDPQLLLRDTARKVENVVLEIEYTLPPRAVNVFWAKPGGAYSQRRMAFSQGGAGEVFYLPPTGGQSLRIDPGTLPGNAIVIKRIAINQPRPFYAFFIPSAGEVILLCVVPGLAACAVALLRQAWALWRKRKAGETP